MWPAPFIDPRPRSHGVAQIIKCWPHNKSSVGRMRLLDTMVLIASLDTEHPLHKRAIHHLRRASSGDVYVPSAAVVELDLELKSHEFSREERRAARTSLLGYVWWK